MARHLPRDEEILRIAAEVFYRRGFDGAKLADIAREAGIVKGSLYHYFESKEQIYERLIEQIFTRLEPLNVVHAPGRADQRLEQYISDVIRLTAENAVEMGLMGRQLVTMDGAIGDWARDFRRRYYAGIREMIRQGQDTGVFGPGDPDALAAFVIGTITAMSEWYRPSGRLPPEKLTEELREFVLNGLMAGAPVA